jgi:hypothetical protein
LQHKEGATKTQGCSKAITSDPKGEIAMTFKTFSIAAAAFVLAAPAVAFASEAAPAQFSHEGVTYQYTTEVTGSERVIRGTAFAGKVPFELHVKGKFVSGTFNHQAVEFTQAEAKSMGILVASN